MLKKISVCNHEPEPGVPLACRRAQSAPVAKAINSCIIMLQTASPPGKTKTSMTKILGQLLMTDPRLYFQTEMSQTPNGRYPAGWQCQLSDPMKNANRWSWVATSNRIPRASIKFVASSLHSLHRLHNYQDKEVSRL